MGQLRSAPGTSAVIPKPPPDGLPPQPGSNGEGSPKRTRGREFVTRGDRTPDPVARNLKLAFEEVASEPLPDDLAALISQIEDKLDGGRNGDR